MISVFFLYFVHHEVEFHFSQFWTGFIFSWGQLWYKKGHYLFSESSVSRLFVPQLIKMYSSDCSSGIFPALHNMYWILSPPIPQFIVLSLKNLYQMLEYLWENLQQWYLQATQWMRWIDDFISAAWFLWFTSQLSL